MFTNKVIKESPDMLKDSERLGGGAWKQISSKVFTLTINYYTIHAILTFNINYYTIHAHSPVI